MSLYELETYSVDRMCKYKFCTYVKVFESFRLTDIHTDTTEMIYHAALQVVNNI